MARRALARSVLQGMALVAAVAWISTAGVAWGQSAGGSTMLGETQAAQEEVRGLEKKLDELVARIRGRVPPLASTRLQRLQVQWMIFAKADCAWERGFSGEGSIAALVYSGCMRQRLIERIERLKPILCEGAGMTGPCDEALKF